MSDTSLIAPDEPKRQEEIVLGGLLRWPAGLDEVAVMLRAEDFGWHHHRLIYQAVLDLWDEGKPLTLETVADELHRRGQINDLGGYQTLGQLWDATPTAANTLYFAKIIRERAQVRRLNAAAGEIVQKTSGVDGPAAELQAEAERLVLSVGEVGYVGSTSTLKEGIEAACDRINERAKQGERPSGLLTGFVDLDRKTAGLQDSELIVLAARPGTGKTACALQIARNVALELGAAVFFASLEMSLTELAERLLCCEGELDGHRLRRGAVSCDDAPRVAAARARLVRANVHVDDQPSQSMLRITANARRLKRQHNIRLAVVDYLQLIEPENRRDQRHEQVGLISRRLKALARELRIPVLALAQLNRSVEGRKGDRPRLSDLRESGEIEQNADVVMMLHKPADRAGVVEVIIGKNRNGPVGLVELAFDAAHTKFSNYAHGLPGD